MNVLCFVVNVSIPILSLTKFRSIKKIHQNEAYRIFFFFEKKNLKRPKHGNQKSEKKRTKSVQRKHKREAQRNDTHLS